MDRVTEVARLYAEGLTQRQIAQRLGISRDRVRGALRSARRRAREPGMHQQWIAKGDRMKDERES